MTVRTRANAPELEVLIADDGLLAAASRKLSPRELTG